MSVTLTYNGFTDLETVRIDEWRQEPVLAEDGVSQETTRHTISGTAVVAHDTDASTWKGRLDSARAKLNQPRKNLTVDVNGQTLLSITAPDDRDGPFPRFELQEIVGSLCALVRFTVEVYDYRRPDGGDTYADAVSHRWTQRWTYDEVGLATRVVSGSVSVRASALTTSASQVASATSINAGSNPEAYRAVVAPTLPPGFRRVRAEFATDETGNRMLYTFEDREFPRGIPKPAKMADCSFTWSMPEGGIGTKIFTCEVEGDAKTTAADLLAAAVSLSTGRIVYTPNALYATADHIVMMEVTEHEMLSRNRVTFRVVALGTSSPSGKLVPSNAPMLSDILGELTEGQQGGQQGNGGVGYAPPTVYGTGGVRGTRRGLWSPSYTGAPSFPTAGWEKVSGTVPVPVYTLPEAEFETLMATILPQSPTIGKVAAGATENTYLHVEISERLQVESGIVSLDSMSTFDADVPFQYRKPVVHLVSEAKAARLNKSPSVSFRAIPRSAFVVSDDTTVSAAAPDANGNAAMLMARRRVVRLLDPGTLAPETANNGYANQFGGETLYRIFWPKKTTLARPLDPRVLIGQAPYGSQSIFDAQTQPDSYQLGASGQWVAP